MVNLFTGQTLMSVFRSLVADEFLSLIVDQCLVKSVPETKKDLLNYKTVSQTVMCGRTVATRCLDLLQAHCRLKIVTMKVDEQTDYMWCKNLHVYF